MDGRRSRIELEQAPEKELVVIPWVVIMDHLKIVLVPIDIYVIAIHTHGENVGQTDIVSVVDELAIVFR